jgi:4-amino-4-deoxy-L-arabinose transferase-like glycosyltransferase
MSIALRIDRIARLTKMARSPGTDAAPIMQDAIPNTSRWLQPVLLAAVSCSLFFARLDTALLEPEETRYAEIAREMFAAGEWVVPLYHGQPYFDKPPLLYWLVMASYSIFGVHDWAARLVPGACSELSVLVVYGWGRRAFGARAGFLGALVLALSARFVYLGRFVATDAPLNLCVLCALACTHLALMEPQLRWRLWIAGGLACGLGLLAKGPTVFVLLAVPATTFLLVNRAAARPGIRGCAAYLAAALLIATPWYAAAQVRDASFAEYFLWKHHVLRYVSPFDHPKPFWFYLPDFIAGTLPWSLLLVPIGAGLWRDRQLLAERRAPDSIFPLLAAVWCLIFFSASGSKRVGYVLPAFAPFALTIGIHLDRWLSSSSQSVRWSRFAPVLPLSALLLGIAATIGLAAFHYCTMGLAIVLCVLLASLTGAVIGFRRRLTPVSGLSATFVLVACECAAGVAWVLPLYAERFSLRREVLLAGEEMPPVARVVCMPRLPDSVAFYLRRDAVAFGDEQRDAAVAYLQANSEVWLFLRDGEAARRFLANLPPSLSVRQRGKQENTLVFQVRQLDVSRLFSSPAETTTATPVEK